MPSLLLIKSFLPSFTPIRFKHGRFSCRGHFSKHFAGLTQARWSNWVITFNPNQTLPIPWIKPDPQDWARIQTARNLWRIKQVVHLRGSKVCYTMHAINKWNAIKDAPLTKCLWTVNSTLIQKEKKHNKKLNVKGKYISEVLDSKRCHLVGWLEGDSNVAYVR